MARWRFRSRLIWRNFYMEQTKSHQDLISDAQARTAATIQAPAPTARQGAQAAAAMALVRLLALTGPEPSQDMVSSGSTAAPQPVATRVHMLVGHVCTRGTRASVSSSTVVQPPRRRLDQQRGPRPWLTSRQTLHPYWLRRRLARTQAGHLRRLHVCGFCVWG
jgi:hypothetical protein